MFNCPLSIVHHLVFTVAHGLLSYISAIENGFFLPRLLKISPPSTKKTYH